MWGALGSLHALCWLFQHESLRTLTTSLCAAVCTLLGRGDQRGGLALGLGLEITVSWPTVMIVAVRR